VEIFEQWILAQIGKTWVALAPRAFQPFESLIFVTAICVRRRNLIRS
jgi:hypothetical protein